MWKSEIRPSQKQLNYEWDRVKPASQTLYKKNKSV